MTVLTIAPNPAQPYRRIRQRTGHRHSTRHNNRAPVPALRGRAEQIVADALDRLGLEWKYEPTRYDFVEGKGFRPDFWLPAYRVYIEVTSTQRSKVIELKETKIRLLREQYGQTAILIAYDDVIRLKARKLNLLDLIQTARAA